MLQLSGRMGLIAPSLWLLNEYGASLRRTMHAGRHLDRWVDFKSYQVFEEAITYTALQFFTRQPNSAVRFFVAADGAVATNWRNAGTQVPYEDLSTDQTWVFLPEPERRFMQRLTIDCDRLDDTTVTKQIFQGLITSADNIYHLVKLGHGRYLSVADKDNPVEVTLEDAIMRPLISGPEVNRYMELKTATHLLFPYDTNEHGTRLYSAAKMRREFPQAWRYLQSHEIKLRSREDSSFDDIAWYRFGRSQNIDKQHLPKLGVAQTVQRLQLARDANGTFCFNNVRVNGILAETEQQLLYLLAILNAPVANWFFVRIAAPKSGGYFEANKQFIAPLPIPRATPTQKRAIGERALTLEQQHSELRELKTQIDYRLSDRSGATVTRRSEDWLLPMLGTLASWKSRAPASLSAPEKTKWAQEQRGRLLETELARMQTAMITGHTITADFLAGELRVFAGDTQIINRIFVSEDQGPFIAALWQHALQGLSSTTSLTAGRLVEVFRRLHTSDNSVLRQQVIDLQGRANERDHQIRIAERDLNSEIFNLYGLSDSERQLIEKA